MSIEKVRAYFEGFGIAGRIREFDVSSATVELAAIAVGVEGARIAKSMSFKLGDEPIIGFAPRITARDAAFSPLQDAIERSGVGQSEDAGRRGNAHPWLAGVKGWPMSDKRVSAAVRPLPFGSLRS